MNELLTLDIILKLLQLVLVPLLGGVAHILYNIRTDLHALRIDLATLEAWRIAHDKQDDERHQGILVDLHDLRLAPILSPQGLDGRL